MSDPAPEVILSVDDNEAGRYATARVLRRAGFEVWEAAHGTEALRLASRNPSLVLLDVNLPDMSGLEVCRRLRSDPLTRHIPILHLSATRIGPTDRAEGLNGGADGYLVQPVEAAELTAAIRSLLRLRERERRLAEAEARLRTTLRSIGDAVIATSPEGRVELLNPVAEALTGWRDEEARGRPLEEVFRVVAEETRVRAEPPVAGALRNGLVTGLSNHTLLLSRDGTERPIANRASPIRDADGRIGGAVLVFRDQTEERKAEEEREKLRAQLAQAQKMDAVGQLAGGVAHDFNNMLAVILGHTALALEEAGPGHPLHEDLEEIRKAAQRSADLTRQLLAFARRQTVAPHALDLNEAVEGTLGMLRRLIGEEIVLAWHPGEGLWPIRIDPAQVDQVLANLVINARDAITGVGTITLETGNADVDDLSATDLPGVLPGEYVVLSVSDDGCGMEKEVRARLFEPFFTTKASGRGTGLGLATVYGMVRQNKGFLDVASEPGMGSTFRIYLPRVKGEAPRALPRHATEVPPARGETVLLAEDEAPVLRLGTELLAHLGYRVLAAGTPAEAIQLARDHPGGIDLLVSDVVMPQMNGRELAEKLLALRPGLRCLFISGYTADVIAHRGILDSGVRFLQKPFSREELAVAVREALDTGRAVQAGVSPAPEAQAGARVLFVDDEEGMVALARRVLGRRGYVVVEHTDPRAALEEFRQSPQAFDVVVTDLAMPELTGLELARLLLEVRPGVPVVLTSGYVRDEDEAAARALGVRAVVLKPATVEELGAELDRVFRTLLPTRGDQTAS